MGKRKTPDEEQLKELLELLEQVWDELHAGLEEQEEGEADDGGLPGLL